MSLNPSADKLAAAANTLANLGSIPALIVLLALNSLQTKFLGVCDGISLLPHHCWLQPVADRKYPADFEPWEQLTTIN